MDDTVIWGSQLSEISKFGLQVFSYGLLPLWQSFSASNSNASQGPHSNGLRKKNTQELFHQNRLVIQAGLLVPQHLHLVDEHHLQHPHPHHPPHLAQHTHISEGIVIHYPTFWTPKSTILILYAHCLAPIWSLFCIFVRIYIYMYIYITYIHHLCQCN